MKPEQKEWIDKASFEELLRKWRFEPIGSEWFKGELGRYYAKVMEDKRHESDHVAVQASKRIGWKP